MKNPFRSIWNKLHHRKVKEVHVEPKPQAIPDGLHDDQVDALSGAFSLQKARLPFKSDLGIIAQQKFPPVTLNNDDKLEVSWKITDHPAENKFARIADENKKKQEATLGYGLKHRNFKPRPSYEKRTYDLSKKPGDDEN